MDKTKFIETALTFGLIEDCDYEYIVLDKELLKIMINSTYGTSQNHYYFQTEDEIFNSISKSINKRIVYPYRNFYVCLNTNKKSILLKRKLKIDKIKNG